VTPRAFNQKNWY